MRSYIIKSKTQLLDIIIPIFDNNPCLTSKQFNYLKFKEALLISLDETKSKEEKLNLIKNIKNKTIPLDYISPI
jgi:hypothetical protein